MRLQTVSYNTRYIFHTCKIYKCSITFVSLCVYREYHYILFCWDSYWGNTILDDLIRNKYETKKEQKKESKYTESLSQSRVNWTSVDQANLRNIRGYESFNLGQDRAKKFFIQACRTFYQAKKIKTIITMVTIHLLLQIYYRNLCS